MKNLRSTVLLTGLTSLNSLAGNSVLVLGQSYAFFPVYLLIRSLTLCSLFSDARVLTICAGSVWALELAYVNLPADSRGIRGWFLPEKYQRKRKDDGQVISLSLSVCVCARARVVFVECLYFNILFIVCCISNSHFLSICLCVCSSYFCYYLFSSNWRVYISQQRRK